MPVFSSFSYLFGKIARSLSSFSYMVFLPIFIFANASVSGSAPASPFSSGASCSAFAGSCSTTASGAGSSVRAASSAGAVSATDSVEVSSSKTFSANLSSFSIPCPPFSNGLIEKFSLPQASFQASAISENCSLKLFLSNTSIAALS